MRTAIAILAALAAIPAVAQKPWEARTDLQLPAPIELPAVPAMNPFFKPLTAQPAILSSPLLRKFPLNLTAKAAIYVDAAGTCRRIVFTDLPLPGLAAELEKSIADTRLSPGRTQGENVPTWSTMAVDLAGRLDEATALQLTALPPNPHTPEVPDVPPAPTPTAGDRQRPSIPAAGLDQPPGVKRFRARIGSHTWRQPLRFLAELGPSGRCERVVFLTCPEGLRPWLVASLAAWTFRPGQDRDGPVETWATIAGELEIDVSTLRSEAVRLIPLSSYPGATATPGADPPPGG